MGVLGEDGCDELNRKAGRLMSDAKTGRCSSALSSYNAWNK